MPKARKHPNLRPLKTLKIFCEGAKTEPNYLQGYISLNRSASRKVVIKIEPTKKNTALQLVEEAIEAKESRTSLPGDQFWVVYDREAVGKYSDEQHAKAYDKALKSGICVALSNVCFEYWILLHFIDTDAPYQNYEDIRRNSLLNEEIKRTCGVDYDKSSVSIFSILKGKIDIARQRGKKLNEKGKKSAALGRDRPYQINPYVGVVDLLQAIDDFS